MKVTHDEANHKTGENIAKHVSEQRLIGRCINNFPQISKKKRHTTQQKNGKRPEAAHSWPLSRAGGAVSLVIRGERERSEPGGHGTGVTSGRARVQAQAPPAELATGDRAHPVVLVTAATAWEEPKCPPAGKQRPHRRGKDGRTSATDLGCPSREPASERSQTPEVPAVQPHFCDDLGQVRPRGAMRRSEPVWVVVTALPVCTTGKRHRTEHQTQSANAASLKNVFSFFFFF